MGPGPLQLVLQVILFVPVRLVYETSGIVDDLLAVLMRCVYLCPLAGRNGFSSRFFALLAVRFPELGLSKILQELPGRVNSALVTSITKWTLLCRVLLLENSELFHATGLNALLVHRRDRDRGQDSLAVMLYPELCEPCPCLLLCGGSFGLLLFHLCRLGLPLTCSAEGKQNPTNVEVELVYDGV